MKQREPGLYIGRFAPSPTGPLHFGSLLAAVASYLQAKSSDGQWLLRIEDIDPPREQPGADQLILASLDAYGFEWDGPVLYQSTNTADHQALVDRLLRERLAYPCSCSRRDLSEAPRGPLGVIYPGTCRSGCDSDDVAIRLLTSNDSVQFMDRLQGKQTQDIEKISGDFVIKRRDGLIAYQLAVVADDQTQGITEVVRGIDLLDSTPRQIFLQDKLGFATPDYAHIPVIENSDRQKLSKLTGATGIPDDEPGPILVAALEALRQSPPPDLGENSMSDIWNWALEHWTIAALTGVESISSGCNPLD